MVEGRDGGRMRARATASPTRPPPAPSSRLEGERVSENIGKILRQHKDGGEGCRGTEDSRTSTLCL